MSKKVILSGTGMYTPKFTLTNEELVDCYNQHADEFNAANNTVIDAGIVKAKPHSSAAFIEKASGIKQRYIYQKEGVLDLILKKSLIKLRWLLPLQKKR